jgi:hypothetical protein
MRHALAKFTLLRTPQPRTRRLLKTIVLSQKMVEIAYRHCNRSLLESHASVPPLTGTMIHGEEQSLEKARALLFSVENTKLSFRAALLSDKNPDVVRLVVAQLPFRTFAGHVVVAGETLWMPTKVVSLGGTNMVKREAGSVYFYEPGTQFNICYGRVTESNPVNQFAQVYDEDLDNLRAVGRLACDQTFTQDVPSIVRINVSLVNAPSAPTIINQPDAALPNDPKHWRVVKAAIERAIEKNWDDEPDEVRNVRLGVIESGAGTREQAYSILVHLKAYLMVYGADMFFRFLKSAQCDEITLPAVKAFTHTMMFGSFNHFIFADDLGMKTLGELGARYMDALDTVTTKDEYVQLTGTLLLFINLMHRWVHNIYPWHHGLQYPHRTPEQVADRPKLATYKGDVENA